MNKTLTKAAAVLLALSMLLPAASCGRKKPDSKGNSGKKITDDTPWFDAQIYDVDQGIDTSKEVEYTYSRFAGSDDEYIVILTNGNYKIPDNIDWNNYDYSDYSIAVLSVLDRATKKTVKTIDLNNELSSEEYAENARYKNGIVTIIYTSYDTATWQTVVKEKDIDLKTGQVTDTRENSDSDSGVFQNAFNIGDYSVETAANWNAEVSTFNLKIISPDGSQKTVKLEDGRKSVYEVSSIIPLSDSTALVIAYLENGNAYYELDLKSGTIKETESKNYDWLDTSVLYNTLNGSDGNVYYTMPGGISKIDIKAKTDEEMFNYSWCGINRNILTNLQLAEVSEDSFLLYGEQYFMNPYTQIAGLDGSEFFLIEFSKAEKNPHAGKTILEMYSSYGYTDDQVADAILKFNETNSNYYIEVADRYKNTAAYDYDSMNSDDDMQSQWLNYSADLSSKLSMDILNGEGPDILMDVSSFGQLNNTECLVDLAPYVGNLDPDKYFTNILDAAKVDGKLYNLPICFSIEGIQTDSKYAGKSGIGFTTEEYENFLKETLNGKDVVSSGQAMYFAKLFNSMSSRFIVNGKADFSDPEFKTLAEFVKNNVQERSASWDEMGNDEYGGYSSYALYGFNSSENGLAMYTECGSYYSFFRNLEVLNGSSSILGLPSADGHGPMAGSYSSVAVSAQSASVDACGEFVKLLMSDSVQEDMATKSGYLVLNREAFRKAGESAIDYYNEKGGVDIFQYDQYGNQLPPKNQLKFNEEQLNDLENIILSCNAMNYEDAAINLILVEEMQPYFAGQKNLEDVYKVAQDRVQKVIDERG